MYKHTEIPLTHVKYGKNQDRLKVLKAFFFLNYLLLSLKCKEIHFHERVLSTCPQVFCQDHCLTNVWLFFFFFPIKTLLGTNMETNSFLGPTTVSI